jgi:hypothetical protein
MATRKAAQLDADLIARKGEAAPASPPPQTTVPEPQPTIPRGTKGTIALTVRLDPERYRKLAAYAAQFQPRKTHQEIMVEALDAYLDQVAE